jgi:hypothetical protein
MSSKESADRQAPDLSVLRLHGGLTAWRRRTRMGPGRCRGCRLRRTARAARHPGRVRLSDVDRVDVNIAGEPLRRPDGRGHRSRLPGPAGQRHSRGDIGAPAGVSAPRVQPPAAHPGPRTIIRRLAGQPPFWTRCTRQAGSMPASRIGELTLPTLERSRDSRNGLVPGGFGTGWLSTTRLGRADSVTSGKGRMPASEDWHCDARRRSS